MLKKCTSANEASQASQPTKRLAKWTQRATEQTDVRELVTISDDAACRRNPVPEGSVCRSVRRNRTPLISRTAARDHGPIAFRNGESVARATQHEGKSTLPPRPVLFIADAGVHGQQPGRRNSSTRPRLRGIRRAAVYIVVAAAAAAVMATRGSSVTARQPDL